MKRPHTAVLDASAVLLSGLCLVHCLILPLLVALSPIFGLWARQEWVHVLLAAMAVPLSAGALWSAHRRRPLPSALSALALLGLACLLAGAAEWLGPGSETPVTVAGGLLLAAAHAWNWARHSHP